MFLFHFCAGVFPQKTTEQIAKEREWMKNIHFLCNIL
jgi:hypothetical protein